MKSPFVNELEPDKVITTSFLVQSKEIRQKKGGEPYLSLLLSDRTGELDAKMWDNVSPDVLYGFERDDFVKVKGLIQVFHNRPQLTIHKVRRMDDSEIEFQDYFPSSRRDSEEMWRELRSIVAGMTNPHLKGLLEALLDDEEIARRYRIAPAAKQIHHAYLGGLIEHVLSLCGLARLTASHYPNIDLDLLLTGAILHDIGKIYELTYERGFAYSGEGQLIGHINIGMRMVAEKLRRFPQFPPRLRTLVDHMVLSHHGQMEFGSPKLPQFPEALLLHYIDDMDSKMECMRAMVENDRLVEGCFTTYSTAMERSALKKDRYLDGAAETPRRRPVTPPPPRAADSVQPKPVPQTKPAAAPAPAAVPEPVPAAAAVNPPAPVARPELAAAHPLFAALPAAKQEN